MATEKGSQPRGPGGHHGKGRKPTRADAAERVVKKIDETLSRKAAEMERKAAQLDRRAERIELASARLQDHKQLLDRISGTLGALDVWTRAEPGGRRPRFTREEIAATAIRIADAEGIDAVSMRRLATEMGAGTMTLYHYVRTKDELLTLVCDAVMGEVVLPPGEALPDDWREAMTVIARRSRDALLRHPWMFDVADDPPLGPNSVRHFDQSLQAASSLDATIQEKLDLVSTIDDYVFGHHFQERNDVGHEEFATDEMIRYCSELIATGEYPQLTKLVEELGFEEAWSTIGAHAQDPDRFERNLARVLDGFEAGIAR